MINNILKINLNGFIIKRLDNLVMNELYHETYKGISGDIWPIARCVVKELKDVSLKQQCESCIQYIDEYIDWGYDDPEIVDCCNDIDFLNKYLEVCKKLGFEVDVLLCGTTREEPKYVISDEEIATHYEFLGFDYGYPGPDYYSCLVEEVKHIRTIVPIELNEYGLLQTEEDAVDFIKARNKARECLPIGYFELGDFIIYKIFRYIGTKPLE